MIKTIAASTVVGLAAIAGTVAIQQPTNTTRTIVRCGIERWPVKTLADPDAKYIKFRPIPTFVPSLVTIKPPRNPINRQPDEMLTYRVVVGLVGYKMEEDGDVHLVVQGQGKTMIVEMPREDCVASNALQINQMKTARSNFLTKYPESQRYKKITGTATIDGVLFFDRKHGQTGVADNGVELHPVTRFSYGR